MLHRIQNIQQCHTCIWNLLGITSRHARVCLLTIAVMRRTLLHCHVSLKHAKLDEATAAGAITCYALFDRDPIHQWTALNAYVHSLGPTLEPSGRGEVSGWGGWGRPRTRTPPPCPSVRRRTTSTRPASHGALGACGPSTRHHTTGPSNASTSGAGTAAPDLPCVGGLKVRAVAASAGTTAGWCCD